VVGIGVAVAVVASATAGVDCAGGESDDESVFLGVDLPPRGVTAEAAWVSGTVIEVSESSCNLVSSGGGGFDGALAGVGDVAAAVALLPSSNNRFCSASRRARSLRAAWRSVSSINDGVLPGAERILDVAGGVAGAAADDDVDDDDEEEVDCALSCSRICSTACSLARRAAILSSAGADAMALDVAGADTEAAAIPAESAGSRGDVTLVVVVVGGVVVVVVGVGVVVVVSGVELVGDAAAARSFSACARACSCC